MTNSEKMLAEILSAVANYPMQCIEKDANVFLDACDFKQKIFETAFNFIETVEDPSDVYFLYDLIVQAV